MNEKQIEEIMQVRDEEFLMGLEVLEFDGIDSEELEEIEELDFDDAA